MYCIETINLSHRFAKNEPVLNKINLQVPDGSVYGFLGPNGAGKTTTLKLILGLLKKQDGSITVFNKSIDGNRIEILKQTGSLIETPSLYTHLTAAENLAVWQKIYQCSAKRNADVLETVGLSATKNKKAGQFSLGMKQRLSIAIALLHNPALLILDEPTNGLDPNGIIEMRTLIKRLNTEQKTTILISSHLLTEIEKMVTCIGIINKGELLFQGSLHELHAKQQQSSTILFETSDTGRTMQIMQDLSLQPELKEGMVNLRVTGKNTIAAINQQLVNNQIDVFQIYTFQNNLESLFIDLTKKNA
ncbi:MAG: ABC transporter ATP-binding protein [Chitinophagaceae bacterium]